LKYVRFITDNEQIRYGVVSKNKINCIEGNIFGTHHLTALSLSMDSVKLLAPVEPSKVVCIGLNYFDHAKEFGKPVPPEPLIFLKPSSCITGHMEKIIYPDQTRNLHYEAELAIVIGRKAKKISQEEALKYVFGYTAANDVTARDVQTREGQWGRAKGFDTFCPLGPWIETEVSDPNNLDIELRLNGEIRQCSNTGNMIFKCSEILEFISSVMTLFPGDVILTGTPAGIGSMKVGDKVEVSIKGIGTLINTVKCEIEQD